MPRPFSVDRQQITAQLSHKAKGEIPLLACAAGNGMTARALDRSGADLIIACSAGYFLQSGLPSVVGNLPVGDTNALIARLGAEQILPRVRRAPVIAGVYLSDPTRDMEQYLQTLIDMGFSGVINFPTVGRLSGEIRIELERHGLGFARELDGLQLAQQLGLFTMGYSFRPEEARAFALAGVDAVVSHAGPPAEGDAAAHPPLDEVLELTRRILDAALDTRPDILPFCYAGPLGGLQNVPLALLETPAVGCMTASCVELAPVEEAIRQCVQRLVAPTPAP